MHLGGFFFGLQTLGGYGNEDHKSSGNARTVKVHSPLCLRLKQAWRRQIIPNLFCQVSHDYQSDEATQPIKECFPMMQALGPLRRPRFYSLARSIIARPTSAVPSTTITTNELIHTKNQLVKADRASGTNISTTSRTCGTCVRKRPRPESQTYRAGCGPALACIGGACPASRDRERARERERKRAVLTGVMAASTIRIHPPPISGR